MDKSFEKVILSLQNLEKTLVKALTAEFEGVKESLEEDLRKRTNLPFQTVPSYLYESRRRFPGRKAYPEGTLATFATSSPPLAGSEWEGQVQKYITGTHTLHDALQVFVNQTAEEISIEAGYEDSTYNAHPEIRRVIFGTGKMQPRPFLQLALSRQEKAFQKAVEAAVGQMVNSNGE